MLNEEQRVIAEQTAADNSASDTVQIEIEKDGMTAFLTLTKPGSSYDPEQVRTALTQAGVAAGIDNHRLSLLLRLGTPKTHEPIAYGSPPGEPTDGYIEYLFPLPARELEEKGGRVDWHRLGLVTSVVAGQPLARRHVGVEGTPGQNVSGTLSPASRHPKEVRLQVGPGVEISPNDPLLLIALTSGSVRIDAAGRVCVDNTHLIAGDVDLSTGDIEFDGSLLIMGDIKRGFVVGATGDVEVRGVIEEATVTAGGSVMCHNGIVSSGNRKVPIRAGRDIIANFATNALLDAGNDILLAQEAINCEIEAHHRVMIGGEHPTNGKIAGGSIKAAKLISAYDIGSSGAKTQLRTGYDWLLARVMPALEMDLAATQERLDRAVQALRRLTELKAQNTITDEQRGTMQTLLQVVESQQAALRSLTGRRDALSHLSATPSGVLAYGTTAAGVELTIDGKTKRMTEDRQKQSFTAKDGVFMGVSIKDEKAPSSEKKTWFV